MKRYKLLKNLPTFNKGDIFRLTKNGSLERESDRTIAYMASTLEKFNILDSEWFEGIPEQERWRAECGGGYYRLGESLSVMEEVEDDGAVDENLHAIGNYFKTREEAQKAANWLKAVAILRNDTKGFKPDWRSEIQYKWYVYYNHSKKGLETSGIWTQQGEALYFASADDADASIKNHEREWLTFFGVEE